MTHDPLCLHFVHIVAGGTACNCDYIAQVRADEREQAMQGLGEAIATEHRDEPFGPLTAVTLKFDPPNTRWVRMSREMVEEWAAAMPIIAAARGEE